MGTSLIRGKHVVTKVIDADHSEIIDDGAIFQRDGEIVDVGPYAELSSKYSPDEEIGSSDFLIIPGLINAHHHEGLRTFQLGARDFPLEVWVAERSVTRMVDPYLDTLYNAMTMIESGITTVMHNMGGSSTAQAYGESGMRVALSPTTSNQNGIVFDDDDDFLATLPSDLAKRVRDRQNPRRRRISTEDFLSECDELFASNHSDRTRIFISPHNVHTCSDDLLQDIKKFAVQHSTGIHLHLQETVYQKMYGTRNWGKTPLAHLYDLGFLGPEVSLAHAVWLTDSDMDILKETGAIVSHNPGSNLRLGSGIAPLNRMLEKGVTVAMGLDSSGLNDENDLLQEMRLAHHLHRVPGGTSLGPTSHQILHMATVNGAKATLFDQQVGTLEPGKRADIVLVNLERIVEPYLSPEVNMVDALIYRGKGSDVDTVIVDGEVLMKNREFTRLNKKEIISRLKDSLNVPVTPQDTDRAKLGQTLLPYVQRFFKEHRPLEKGSPHYYYNEVD